MAKRKTDVNHRSDTLGENNLVLRDLRTRKKMEHRSSQELNKLFTKLNSESSSKHLKNAKISSGTRQEKITTQHSYGPLKGFPVGSWWGIRMDCSRDRIHEPFNKDIQEGRLGAVSLCTSHLATNDVDLGDSLSFTGGKYEPGVSSDDPLLRSYHSQVPLRLVRSYNLTNEYAPKTGYRYDGLYTVAAYWIGVTLNNEKHYKYALIRVPNQDPPAWHVSARSSIKLAHPSRKSSGSQNPRRCNIQRFSTNLCSETHLTSNERETTNPSRSRNEKYSFNKSSAANGTEKIAIESKKISNDSAIVTRCISNKKIECSSNGIASNSCLDSSLHSASRHLENSPKPPQCKLQNTNISIRTDLYESYLHQEPVKVTPMTFCRTFKSSRGPPHIVKHSNVGTLNLNSCGPCPRDKEQESQIQSRSGVAKFPSTQSPCSDSNRNADRSSPKVPIEAKTSSVDRTTNAINPEVESMESSRSVIEKVKDKTLEQVPGDKENSPDKTFITVAETSTETIEKTETICPITRMKSKESVEATAIIMDESDEDKMLKESHETLDSLTPDQMLNFIVKQKYHPRAKLLIGSVIGLATGESTILRAYDSLISRQKHWNRSQAIRSAQKDSPVTAQGVNSPNAEQSYECRQGSSGTSRKNERSAPKTISKKRIMKERMLKMRLRRTRVSKRSSGGEKKSITKPTETMSQRLRKAKVSEKSQQPFSKPTIHSKSAKGSKKRAGELARLVIDANMGPKVRGLRNRRLRGTTHIFTRKRRANGNQGVPSCCAGTSSDVGLKGKKGNARVELSSTRSKRLSSSSKTRIPHSRFMDHKKKVQEEERIPRTQYVERNKSKQEIETVNSDRRYRSEAASELEARAENVKKFQSLANKGAKRKMPRSNSPEQTFNGSSKRSCRGTSDDSKIRKSQMVDAATQCSERRDAATSVEREIEQTDQENSIKVEWIDLDDVKSETRESDDEEHLYFETERYESNSVRTSRENSDIYTRPQNVVPIRPQAAKPQMVEVTHRLSAFVPVNLSNSDFRIARLRSIGFRPIVPDSHLRDKDPLQEHMDYENCASSSCKDPTVVSRVVDEQYNKYTSEETDVVEYMDQELRYQDIEDEEVEGVGKNSGKTSKKGPRMTRNKKIVATKSGINETAKGQCVSGTVEDDLEAPWHGWKKFVKNKQAH